MNGKQLKNSILQWAIQGKLVPQDPNDEPASVLLEKIRAEKERLVKEGKLKKKDLEVKPIAEDEIPFEIPKGWEWCRMSSVVDVRDGTHDTPSYVVQGYPLITGKDFYKGYFELSKTQYISEADYLEICKRSKVDVGDILFSMIGGNIGSQILITENNYFEMAIKNVALFKHYSLKEISTKYLSYYLNARIEHIKSVALGGAQSFVSLQQLRTYLFPLPPLAEQHRIVAKIEELMPLVEKYGAAQEALDEWNQALPEKLKKSILQEAIQGKLVPQDPADEPASVLLERIREEKKRLVKEGKLKKKDLEVKPIEEDEIPFEIPESWEWVRLHDISKTITKGTTPRGGNVAYSLSGIGFLRAENVGGFDKLDLTNLKYVTEEEHKGFLSRSIIEVSDILITIAGTLGRTALVKKEHLPLNANQAVSIVRLVDSHSLSLKFLIYALNEPNIQKVLSTQRKVTAIPNLTLEIISDCLIPLPPLAEQRRIVAKIEELFGVINN